MFTRCNDRQNESVTTPRILRLTDRKVYVLRSTFSSQFLRTLCAMV
jgi:hypothetical protein